MDYIRSTVLRIGMLIIGLAVLSLAALTGLTAQAKDSSRSAVDSSIAEKQVAPAVFAKAAPQPGLTCGEAIADIDGYVYGTVQVGSQCWTASSLRTKSKPDGTCINDNSNNTSKETCPNASPADNGQGRSCYNNVEANCATDGALYTWQAAMNGSVTPGAQGICPAGWHLPTDAEQHQLELYLTDVGQTCNPARITAWDCASAGTKLKVGGSSGFNALLAGARSHDGVTFNARGWDGIMWSSSMDTTTPYARYSAYARYVGAFGEHRVARHNLIANYSVSVRCVKNS